VQISARVGSVRALEALLKNGGVADEESMMLAVLTEKIEAMKLLEKYGGNIAQTDKNGCSTLHYIAQDGTQEMVRYLLEKGVPINATCRGKETPLTWANYGKNIEVIQYLQSRGAR
jgi:FOG: Ankyrin repeat